MAVMRGETELLSLVPLVHIADNYHSFWASSLESASRCDSGSYRPRTLHICPPVCKSRPLCRSPRAVRKKRTSSSINQADAVPDFYTHCDVSAGKIMPWENSAGWFVTILFGNKTQEE